MPDVSTADMIFGLCVAATLRLIINRLRSPRRLPIWATAVFAVMATLVAEPALDVIRRAVDTMPILSGITSGQLFIGIWAALVAFFVFEQKDKPRRVPVWAAFLIGLAAMFGLPPLLDAWTGKYQDASLLANVNQCTDGMLGQTEPRQVRNTCDHPIVVGLCLPDETNPDPCSQSFHIAAGQSVVLDAQGENLAALPSTPAGFTVVACRPPGRPSRALKVGGKGHRGICLPES